MRTCRLAACARGKRADVRRERPEDSRPALLHEVIPERHRPRAEGAFDMDVVIHRRRSVVPILFRRMMPARTDCHRCIALLPSDAVISMQQHRRRLNAPFSSVSVSLLTAVDAPTGQAVHTAAHFSHEKRIGQRAIRSQVRPAQGASNQSMHGGRPNSRNDRSTRRRIRRCCPPV